MVQPYDQLSFDEIKDLPQPERAKFYESSVLGLIIVNGNRGLTTSEIERATRFPKTTLLKTIELLFHKRKIHRIRRGKFSLYYPHGMEVPNKFRDITYGENNTNLYGVKLIQNVEGQFVLIQEREIDEYGFNEDIGGVLIPVSKVTELINLLKLAIDQPQNVIKGGKRIGSY